MREGDAGADCRRALGLTFAQCFTARPILGGSSLKHPRKKITSEILEANFLANSVGQVLRATPLTFSHVTTVQREAAGVGPWTQEGADGRGTRICFNTLTDAQSHE